MTSSPEADSGESPLGVLLVCHAGAALGIGHLTRTLALANALAARGRASIRMIIQGEAVVRDDLSRIEHSFVSLDDDLAALIDMACVTARPDVVVFDLHPRLIPDDFAGFLSGLRNQGFRLVGVDALLVVCDSLDVTWVPSLLVEDDASARCSVEYGWDSFLIHTPTPTAARQPGNSVLVLTGGSDVTHQHETLPTVLDANLPGVADVHWVRGPFGGDPKLPDQPRLSWTVHQAPAGLGELIGAADYAITVFGVTLFELLAHGVPTVVFSPYVDRTFPELDEVAAVGAAVVAGDAGSAVTELADLMGDRVRADRIAAVAKAKMAVNGAQRLADLIHSMTE